MNKQHFNVMGTCAQTNECETWRVCAYAEQMPGESVTSFLSRMSAELDITKNPTGLYFAYAQLYGDRATVRFCDSAAHTFDFELTWAAVIEPPRVEVVVSYQRLGYAVAWVDVPDGMTPEEFAKTLSFVDIESDLQPIEWDSSPEAMYMHVDDEDGNALVDDIELF